MTDAYYAGTSLLRDHLSKLLASIPELDLGHSPATGSSAESDIGLQTKWGADGAWGPDPLGQTHMYAFLLVRFVDDCFTASLRLTAAEPTSLFGHEVTFRAGLEGCALLDWLLEADATPRDRVVRGMNARLKSQYEIAKFAGIDDEKRKKAERRVGEILEAAVNLEFELTEAGVWLKPGPRPQRQLLKRLFDHLNEDIGEGVYRLLSSVAHGGLLGLGGKIKMLDSTPIPGTSNVLGGVFASAATVNTYLAAAIYAFTRAADTVQTFTGTPWIGWPTVSASARSAAGAVLDALHS